MCCNRHRDLLESALLLAPALHQQRQCGICAISESRVTDTTLCYSKQLQEMSSRLAGRSKDSEQRTKECFESRAPRLTWHAAGWCLRTCDHVPPGGVARVEDDQWM